MSRTGRQQTHDLLAMEDCPSIEQMIKCKRFSSLSWLLSITSWVLQISHSPLSKLWPTNVHIHDLVAKAEVLWIRANQQSLPQNSRCAHWKIQFDFFEEEDKLSQWQCGGQLQNTNLLRSTIHPILLNKELHVHLTILYICWAHNTEEWRPFWRSWDPSFEL